MLYLDSNWIRHLTQNCFVGLSSLQTLGLSHNNLTSLSARIFVQLVQLKALDLSYNPLVNIADGAFVALYHLRSLRLNFINVPSISIPRHMLNDSSNLELLEISNSPQLAEAFLNDTTQFQWLTAVVNLDLRNNDLSELPEILQQVLPNLLLVRLSGNPWHCDSSLTWLLNWMQNGMLHFYQSDGITCETPLELHNRRVIDLSRDELLGEKVVLPTLPHMQETTTAAQHQATMEDRNSVTTGSRMNMTSQSISNKPATMADVTTESSFSETAPDTATPPSSMNTSTTLPDSSTLEENETTASSSTREPTTVNTEPSGKQCENQSACVSVQPPQVVTTTEADYYEFPVDFDFDDEDMSESNNSETAAENTTYPYLGIIDEYYDFEDVSTPTPVKMKVPKSQSLPKNKPVKSNKSEVIWLPILATIVIFAIAAAAVLFIKKMKKQAMALSQQRYKVFDNSGPVRRLYNPKRLSSETSFTENDVEEDDWSHHRSSLGLLSSRGQHINQEISQPVISILPDLSEADEGAFKSTSDKIQLLDESKQ